MIARLPSLICLITLLWVAGCDSGPAQRAVEGTVTFAGKPLDHGMIMFQPNAGRLCSAGIQPDGYYSVSLAPDNYRVFLNSPPKLPEGFKEGDPLPPSDANQLPAKFGRKETSGLSAKVEPGGGVQTIDFALQ